jgi:light-regulated signal transduction histidine kinase (bacteriophytochrome)
MDLEKSNRDLEQFAYVASHDLQEPLRKIQTFAELSEKNIEYPVILKRYLQKINSSANRMSELIKAVLNYSRLAQSENEFVEVDLNHIVGNIKTDLELLIEEKKAVINADKLPTIKAIPLQVGQLFLNLISNSLKFCKNPPHINITSRVVTNEEIKKEARLKKETNYLQLTFSDNGIGFDQQYADRVFSIFQRLHSNSEYAGTGIGLALCKKIVENHNGLITVESELNKGTSFHIYLPLTDQRKSDNITGENGKIVQQLNRLVKD